MSYIVAGYAVGLSALFAYGVSLLARRSVLERRLASAPPEVASPAHPMP